VPLGTGPAVRGLPDEPRPPQATHRQRPQRFTALGEIFRRLPQAARAANPGDRACPPSRRGHPVKGGRGVGSTSPAISPRRGGGFTLSRGQPPASATQARRRWARDAISAPRGGTRAPAADAAAHPHGARSASLPAAGGPRTRPKRPRVATRRGRWRPWRLVAPASLCARLGPWAARLAHHCSRPRRADDAPCGAAPRRGAARGAGARGPPGATRARPARPSARAAARGAAGARRRRPAAPLACH
jgi:hypothetical protein